MLAQAQAQAQAGLDSLGGASGYIHKSSAGQRGDFEGTALPLSFYTEACSTAPPHPHCQEVLFTTAPKYQPANHVLKL